MVFFAGGVSMEEISLQLYSITLLFCHYQPVLHHISILSFMKKRLLALFLLFCFNYARSQILTPRELFPGLFEAVQLSDIFHDNKTFVDATPKYSPEAILKRYNELKNQSNFNLKQFVTDNFMLPVTEGRTFKSDISKGIRKYIDTLWYVLSRKHNTALPVFITDIPSQ